MRDSTASTAAAAAAAGGGDAWDGAAAAGGFAAHGSSAAAAAAGPGSVAASGDTGLFDERLLRARARADWRQMEATGAALGSGRVVKPLQLLQLLR
jgi:hypothetical protein